MDYKTALLTFKNSQEFQTLRDYLTETKPEIPRWDRVTDNTDDMKYHSALLEGYELALKKLNMK